jgi:hypothetical protein
MLYKIIAKESGTWNSTIDEFGCRVLLLSEKDNDTCNDACGHYWTGRAIVSDLFLHRKSVHLR